MHLLKKSLLLFEEQLAMLLSLALFALPPKAKPQQNLPASLVHHSLAQVFTASHDTPKRDYPDTAQLRNSSGRDVRRDALPLLAFLVLMLHRIHRRNCGALLLCPAMA